MSKGQLTQNESDIISLISRIITTVAAIGEQVWMGFECD